jgi:hypothetical protein
LDIDLCDKFTDQYSISIKYKLGVRFGRLIWWLIEIWQNILLTLEQRG